ncbi:aspartate-semialdehyde dehydrogenase [Sagittula sp. S175]|uniref:aspartate-semialdehyde dehydrogenase n=1 Tax=Sagittula sp. S175 TaxID=3415129 RepID=UPI003C7C1938
MSNPANPPFIAIVGATGAVGVELLGCLERRGTPLSGVRLLASARSAGRLLPFRGAMLAVEELTEHSFDGVDIALFSAGATLSRQYAPIALRAGARVVDNSSAFRMQADVPLIVPEANGDALRTDDRLIANPNCVAAIASVALAPLARLRAITRLNMATYQAASGAGAAAVEELRQGTRAILANEPFEPQVLPHTLAFNFFSHNAAIDPDSGYNGEELKVMEELRRILTLPGLPIGVTCIRVPVPRAHGISLSVEFDTPLAADEARAALQGAPGLRVVDDRAANHFPMPSEASGQDDVLVGRIRSDLGDPSGRTLTMFVVGDQLLKGAALNAVQIAEALLAGSPALAEA